MKRPLERLFLTVSLLIISAFMISIARDHSVPQLVSPASNPTQSTESFSIIVLPDTQVYAQFFPEIFLAQTAWIAAQKKALNIIFVSQEGDIVNIYDDENQWLVADAAFKSLDGVIPYGLSPGNHDFSPIGDAPLYKKYFPLSRFERSKSWGGTYEFAHLGVGGAHYNKNSYHLLEAGKARYIAFNLEHCPTDDVIDWTEALLRLHPDRRAIITTHSFTDFRGQRSDKTICKVFGGEGDNAGEEIWEKLVRNAPHPNVFLFLSGHDIITAQGAARRTDEVHGLKIHQILANYQQLHRGGNGYLRIMTFKPRQDLIQVETYSPYLDQYMTDPENQFVLPLN